MATYITCDRCKKDLSEGSVRYQLTNSFNKKSFDLCKECYDAFLDFIGEKRVDPAAVPFSPGGKTNIKPEL